MKKNLVYVGSFIGLLYFSSAAVAVENNAVNNENNSPSTVLQSSEEFSSFSTSSTDLEKFEVDSVSSDMFTNTGEESEIAQAGGFTSSTSNNWYVGGTLGVFFPSDGLLKNGFGGSGYVGYQFTPNVGAELGLLYAGSDLSDRSGDGNIFSVIGSARYMAPFEANSNWNYFGTAGVGFTRSSVTAPAIAPVPFGTGQGQAAIDRRDTSFSFELKGGVGYEFAQNTSAFAQLRYLNVTGSNSNYLSTELGIHYKF